MSDREYLPERILICSASGDWIPEEDGPGCPHRDCNGEWGGDPCKPIPYVRASPDQVTVNRADIAAVSSYLQHMPYCAVGKKPRGLPCDCASGRLRAALKGGDE